MKRFLRSIAALALAVFVGLMLRSFVVGFTFVAGDSMNDTLMTGDVALLSRWDYLLGEPQRGDIAQLELEQRGGLYLKRVIGLPGETVEITDGVVYIEGRPLNEPYVTPSEDDYYIELGWDEYFVLGDNRAVSYDSREEDFGAVSIGCFRGRVRGIIWPPERIGFGIE